MLGVSEYLGNLRYFKSELWWPGNDSPSVPVDVTRAALTRATRDSQASGVAPWWVFHLGFTIHVNPPRSSGSLPEMQPDSRTPGSETEPPGCENTKKKKKKFFLFFFQTIIFAHMYGNYGHLLLEGKFTARLVWIYRPLTKWHLILKHHTEKAIKSFSDDMQWEFIISYLFL